MEMTPNRKKIDLPQKRQGLLLKLLKVTPGASHKLSTRPESQKILYIEINHKKGPNRHRALWGVRKPY